MKSRSRSILPAPASLSGADLRQAIALEILGWKVAKGSAPKDYDGQNAGDLVTPNGQPMAGYNYPPRGQIHPAFHVPAYDTDLARALELAAVVKLPNVTQILPRTAEAISRRCLAHWRATHGARVIKLPCHGITITLDGHGAGTIKSKLRAEAPEDGGDEFGAAMDALESLILAHACAGIDVAAPAYVEGIETAIEASVANLLI